MVNILFFNCLLTSDCQPNSLLVSFKAQPFFIILVWIFLLYYASHEFKNSHGSLIPHTLQHFLSFSSDLLQLQFRRNPSIIYAFAMIGYSGLLESPFYLTNFKYCFSLCLPQRLIDYRQGYALERA